MRTIRGLTLLEIIVVIAILGILACLIAPIRWGSRERANRTQCASNIRQILTAMYLYSDSPSNGGRMPTLAPSKDDPFANSQSGIAAMSLLYRQYVNDPRIFACPSDPKKPTPQLKSTLRGWPETGAAPIVVQSSYAYDPGHSTSISSMVALISDKPGTNGVSDNHGPRAGQNVGFGTSVEFREKESNPLGDGARDNSIFTLGDTTAGKNGPVTRDEDSFIRE